MLGPLGFIGLLVRGGLIGAFGVSFLFVLWTALFQRELFGDGQYPLAFLYLLPLGWVLGALVGLGMALANQAIIKPHLWVVTAAGIIIGGAVLIPFPGMFCMMLFFNTVGIVLEWFKR